MLDEFLKTDVENRRGLKERLFNTLARISTSFQRVLYLFLDLIVDLLETK